MPSTFRAMMKLVIPSTSAMRSMGRRSFFFFCTAASNRERRVSMVQGASRGIGLEFVRQLLKADENGHVIATCRNPNVATGLLELKRKFVERLSILPLDVTNEITIEICINMTRISRNITETVRNVLARLLVQGKAIELHWYLFMQNNPELEAAATKVRERYGALNLLINASGVLSIPEILEPERTLSKLEKSSLLLTYEVNAVGPILVIKHMWPLLRLGGGSGTNRGFAVVASLSARVGSIGDNSLGGWHSYRASKAALNQLTKTISVEFAQKKDPIICLLLHPGTVDTDLSRPFQRNVPEGKLFTKEFSVQKLLSIIDNARASDNGKFFAWDGQEIPW